MVVAPPKTEFEIKAETSPLIMADEFLELCQTHPDFRDGLFELVWGEIIRKMNNEEHGFISGNIYGFLWTYQRQTKIGRVLIEVGTRNPDDKHNIRQPDVLYYFDATRPIVNKGAIPLMPDLAVEVQSPSQSRREMREKADYYLRNGSKLVWIIYPDTRTVEICTWTGESLTITTLDDKATLTGGDVLPDFTVSLTEIFPAQTESPKSE